MALIAQGAASASAPPSSWISGSRPSAGCRASRSQLAAVGRWFWHLQDGEVFHPAIADAAPSPNDIAIGWIAHYGVGILYGIVFALIVGPGWFAAPTLLPAWIFAIVTVAAGWFLLQPGMGLGWAASGTPNPTKVRVISLLNHTVFGLGLWLTGLLLR